MLWDGAVPLQTGMQKTHSAGSFGTQKAQRWRTEESNKRKTHPCKTKPRKDGAPDGERKSQNLFGG